MPGELVERAALRILFPPQNRLMLREGDRALFLEDRLGPLPTRQDRFRQPAHIEREVVQPSQVNIGADGSGAQDLKQMFGARIEEGCLRIRSKARSFIAVT